MSELSPDCLRTLYQESASMFLLSASDKVQDQTNNMKNTYIQSSKDLILRSMYDSSPTDDISKVENRDHVSCILSSSSSIDVGYNSQSPFRCTGTNQTSIPSDLEDKEFACFEKNFQSLRESTDVSSSNSIQQMAEAFSNYMLSAPIIQHGHRNVVRTDFYCSSCGLPYMPIHSSNNSTQARATIRLKTLKRGKTRKRRASRYNAAKYTRDHVILQKHRGGGKSFSNPMNTGNHSHHGSAVAAQEAAYTTLKTKHASMRIRDGIAKHCIVYKCSCGNTQSFKGFSACKNKEDQKIIPPKNEEVKINNLEHRMKNNNNSRCRSDDNLKKQTNNIDDLDGKFLALPSSKPSLLDMSSDKSCRSDDNLKKQTNNIDDLDGDFLALPSSKTSLLDTSSDKSKPRKLPLSLPAGKPPKKRKAAKPNKPKSNKSGLHDFLSSLND